MIKRSMMFIMVSVFAGLVLSACTSTQETAVTPEATNPPTVGATTEVATEPETEETEVEISRLFVGPQKVECTGEGPQECLLVKENPEDKWQFFYEQIIGFDYEEGYDYEIEVAITPVDNPPAGGSSLEYTLVRILNKQQSPDFPPEAEEVTWIVGPELAECVGVGPQTCMQIKENPEDEWQLFYDSIEGFEYEEGNEYVIRVLVEPVENPPADASSLSYTLIEVVAQEEVSGMETDTAVSGETTLEDTLWSLTTLITPNGTSGELFPETKITLQFAAADFNGNAGCNNYFGSYTKEGNALTIGEIGSTQKLCLPEEVNSQESAYLSQLSAIAQYLIEGEQLSLSDANGNILLTYAATEPATLTNTLWEVTFYNNGRGGAVSVVGGTQITAQFGEDGSLGGNASCNSYSTSYELDGENITIPDLIATTLMACATPEGVMEQEAEYLAALPTAATYTIQEDTLELRTNEGSLVASYTATKAPTVSGSAWDVVSYNNGKQAVVSVIIGSSLSAEFQEDGTLTGNAGCNSYRASYEIDGDNISIGTTVTTRMFCEEPEGVMDQEAQYLAALQTAVTYSINGERMEMRTAEGSKVAGFIIQGYVPPEIQSALDNATYSSEFTESGEVTLVNGEFSEQIVEGSATQLRIQNLAFTAIGKNTDGETIITTVLVSDPGGSGTFYSLHVMQYQDSTLVEVAATSLGDRVQINSVEIVDGAVVVDMITHDEDDPFCCPTQQVINTYQIQEGELILSDSQIVTNISAEIQSALDNATYSSEFTKSGSVTLVNGEFSESIVEGSATQLRIQNLEFTAIGTDADGEAMIATVLVSDPGGSGTFYSLHVMQYQDGTLVEVAATSLGDRVQINSVEIVDGVVVVDMITHGEEDPLCCPTQQVINTYQIQEGELILSDSQIVPPETE